MAGQSLPAMPNVVRQRLADANRQGQGVVEIALAADQDPTPVPTDVVEADGHDFRSPKAETRRQHEDRVVAPCLVRVTASGIPHPLNVIRTEKRPGKRVSIVRQTSNTP